MKTLAERIKSICAVHKIPDDHTTWYIDSLDPIAIANNDYISDDMIWKQITYREFWLGLGIAIMGYLQWEQRQV